MTKAEAQTRIAKLRSEIEHHRYLYHVLDKPEISDSALDSLKHELFKLEQQYPELITPSSPTQRVGGKALAQFNKVKHPAPILSIEDAFSIEEVTDWQARNEKFMGERIKGYFGELKMDGLSIVLTYDQGLLVRGATRGDGKVGEDVTQNIRTIESIPLSLVKSDNLALPKKLDVRGEIVITKAELERINNLQIKAGLPIFANPRNLAAGSIRQLDARVAAERQMEFYAFEILTDIGQATHAEVHEQLKRFGFKTNKYCQELVGIQEIESYVKKWESKRAALPYQTDGVVIVVNDIKQERTLGSVGKADRWMLAFKFPAEQATTQIKDIIIQVGRTGALTPVAILEPVRLAGSTVSRATLHNEDEIRRLDVRVGDTVIAQKAGDIIPDIVQVLPKLRTGKEKVWHMPKNCPACDTLVQRKVGEVAWYCKNVHCPARTREGLYHFVSRTAFNIDGLGPRIIDQLIEVGLINDAADFFALKMEDLVGLEGFADKAAQNLIRAIAHKKTIPLSRFIYSLGIRHVGIETALVLAQHFGTLEKIISATEDDLKIVTEVGPVVAKSITEFFASSRQRRLLDKFKQAGIKITHESRPSGKWSGKTAVVTGTLASFSREQAKQAIRNLGGNVSETVSQATSFVVVGEKPGSKYDQAKKLGIEILNEAEFIKLIKSA